MATKSGERRDRELWRGEAEEHVGLGRPSRLVENPVVQPGPTLRSATAFLVGRDPAASLVPPRINAGRDKQAASPRPQWQGHH